jgi:hypothetical protein
VTCSQAERKAEYSYGWRNKLKILCGFPSGALREDDQVFPETIAETDTATTSRICCSGGNYPISGFDDDDDGDATKADGFDQTRTKKKKEVKYSNVVFTSKFNVLLAEHERIRVNN